MVAGQHAEAAGVLGEGLGDAELGGEVGDRPQRRALAGLEPAVAVEVALELVAHVAEEAPEPGVVDEGLEPVAGHHAQQAHGIVHGRVPRVGVDPLEQVAGLGVPRPAQVHGQLLQRGELGGQGRPDGEAAEGLHPGRPYPAATTPGPCRSPPQRNVHVRVCRNRCHRGRRRETRRLYVRDGACQAGGVGGDQGGWGWLTADDGSWRHDAALRAAPPPSRSCCLRLLAPRCSSTTAVVRRTGRPRSARLSAWLVAFALVVGGLVLVARTGDDEDAGAALRERRRPWWRRARATASSCSR